MAEPFEKALQIGRAYGALTRAIAQQSNAERLRIAEQNFRTGRSQIDAQRAERTAELSRVFQRHVGQLQANAAYRGVGQAGSTAALVGASVAEAAVARRNIEINANNAIASLGAQSQPVLEDEQLAEMEGTFRGLSIGSDFAAAVASLPSTTKKSSKWVQTGLGWQELYSFEQVPGSLDLSKMFPEFNLGE